MMRLCSTGFSLCVLIASAQAPVLTLTAQSENAGPIRIDILRWSTDAERDHLFQAWTEPGASAGRGRAAARGPVLDDDPAAEPQARGGRGGRGRGAAAPSEAPKITPERSLKTALESAPIVGHLWSSEVAGYAIRYAAKLDGGQRIVLITDRRLGAWNNLWKAAGTESNYDFSMIELRLNPKGEGEGRTSLTGKVAAADKMLGIENYSAMPVMLKNVKVR